MTQQRGVPKGRYVFVTWDGAGNLPVTLGVAERLAERGHDVRLLTHRSVDRRCGSHGWRFKPLRHGPEFDSCRVADMSNEIQFYIEELWCNPIMADEVFAEFEAEPADVVAVDCMLYGGMCAAIASSARSVGLFHLPYSTPVGQMAIGLDALNPVRKRLNQEPISRLGEIWDGLDLAVVAAAREFEGTQDFGAHVQHVGPVLDGPPLMVGQDSDDFELPEGDGPLVLVSMSTSFQDQNEVLQRVASALGDLPVRALLTSGPAVEPASLDTPANVAVRSYVPHHRVLSSASVVVTHAGLGTTMAALRHGVPLLCMPMGRDQGLNAMTVEQLGVGRMVPCDSSPSDIAKSIVALLESDSPERRTAQKLATAFAGYGGSAHAVSLLERLLPGD